MKPKQAVGLWFDLVGLEPIRQPRAGCLRHEETKGLTMSSKLKHSVAILAIAAGLGSAALAQTEAPQAGRAEVTAETLPDVLKSLNLQDLDIDKGRREVEIDGTTADGTEIEAMLNREGELRFIRADDDAALPASVVETLVPEAVRSSETFAQFSVIEGVGIAPPRAKMAGVMIMGVDADGEKMRAGFTEDGTLTRFGRGDHDRHGRRGDGHRRGDKMGKRDHSERWGKGGHGRDHDRGAAMDDGQGSAAMFPAAVIQTLTNGGYSEIGPISRNGPLTVVEAINSNDEPVTVEINPRGEVIRETAR